MAKNLYLTFPGHGYIGLNNNINGISINGTLATVQLDSSTDIRRADIGSEVWTNADETNIESTYYTLVDFDDTSKLAYISGSGLSGVTSGTIPGAVLRIEDLYKFSLDEAPDFVAGRNARNRWIPVIQKDGTTTTLGYSYDIRGGLSSVGGLTVSTVYSEREEFRELIKFGSENILDANKLFNIGDQTIENSYRRNEIFLRPVESYMNQYFSGSSSGSIILNSFLTGNLTEVDVFQRYHGDGSIRKNKFDALKDSILHPGEDTFNIKLSNNIINAYDSAAIPRGLTVDDVIDEDYFMSSFSSFNNRPVWIGTEAIALISSSSLDSTLTGTLGLEYNGLSQFTCNRGVLKTKQEVHFGGQESVLIGKYTNASGQKVKINIIEQESSNLLEDEIQVYDGFVESINFVDNGASVSFEIVDYIKKTFSDAKEDDTRKSVQAFYLNEQELLPPLGSRAQVYEAARWGSSGRVAIKQAIPYFGSADPYFGSWRWVCLDDIALRLRKNGPERYHLVYDDFVSDPLDQINESVFDYKIDPINKSYEFVYYLDQLIFYQGVTEGWEWGRKLVADGGGNYYESPYNQKQYQYDNGVVIRGAESFDTYVKSSRASDDISNVNNLIGSDGFFNQKNPEKSYFSRYTASTRNLSLYQTGSGGGAILPPVRVKGFEHVNIPIHEQTDANVYTDFGADANTFAVPPSFFKGKEIKACHVFEPIENEEHIADMVRTFINRNTVEVNINEKTSYIIPISLGEFILQILTSKNGYMVEEEYRNGPYDVLPPGVGLGIPIENIDVDSFFPRDELGLSLPFLINKSITSEDASKITELLDKTLKDYGVVLKVIGTKIYLQTPNSISVASAVDMISDDYNLSSEDDIVYISTDEHNHELTYIYSNTVNTITLSWKQLGLGYDRVIDSDLYSIVYDNTQIFKPNLDTSYITTVSLKQESVSRELDHAVTVQELVKNNSSMMDYISRPLIKLRILVDDQYGVKYEPNQITSDFSDYLSFLVKVNLNEVLNFNGSYGFSGYGVVTDRKWDVFHGISEIELLLLYSDDEIQLISGNINTLIAPSFVVGSGANATVIPVDNSDYYTRGTFGFREGDKVYLYDENFNIRSAVGGIGDPKEILEVSSNYIRLTESFENNSGNITANAGDIIILAEIPTNTDESNNEYAYYSFPLSVYLPT